VKLSAGTFSAATNMPCGSTMQCSRDIADRWRALLRPSQQVPVTVGVQTAPQRVADKVDDRAAHIASVVSAVGSGGVPGCGPDWSELLCLLEFFADLLQLLAAHRRFDPGPHHALVVADVFAPG
jgi:hypothetical protein